MDLIAINPAAVGEAKVRTVRKIMVLTFHNQDYELMQELLANAREKIPDMEMDSAVSAIVADALCCYRIKKMQTK